MKAAFYTLGCKVNSYDTQAMKELFMRNGYEIVSHSEKADVYVVNTCAVTAESERKSRQAVRKLKKHNPQAITIFTGCYVQSNLESAREVESADIICGTHHRERIIDYLNDFLARRTRIELIENDNDFDTLSISDYEGKNRAFLKIQDGCNMFCSYCIIPYARGKLKNASADSVINQIRNLSLKGYKECVITGIHIASYRSDTGENLIDILEKIDDSGLVERIRLGSLEPKLLTEKFLSRLARLESICDHFHISLQSGSSRILKLMNRRYTREEYIETVKRVKKYFPNAGITTDIIVGFPSESEEDFSESMSIIRECGFSFVHIFPYSARKGTPAAEMKEQLTNAAKHERVLKLQEAMQKERNTFLSGMAETENEVLIEKKLADGLYGGYTKNYIYTEVKSDMDILDKIVKVRITGINDNGHLGGTLI